jgi:uncharacterized integral membrane protein
MLMYLIAGICVGALAVYFALQNTAPVTVAFLQWDFTAPLALVLLGAVAVGLCIAALMMLPSAISETLDAYARRREIRRQAAAASYEAQALDQSVIA